MTKAQFDETQPEHGTPTWFDAELKKRAEARKAAAGVAEDEAEQPKRRLVRRSR